MQIVWFKRDLRIHDHAPLTQAVQHGRCIGVYFYEPELFAGDDFDGAHLNFINQSLSQLRQSLRRLGGELLIRTANLPEGFDRLFEELPFEKIWAHEETFNDISYRRDQRVRRWAKSKGVSLKEIPQYGVVRRLDNRDGWARRWNQRMKLPIVEPPRQIEIGELEMEPGDIQDSSAFAIRTFDRKNVQIGGEAESLGCLDSFLATRGVNYRSDMSSPLTGESGCSRLSTYIAQGNISIKTIHQRTAARVAELKELKKSGQEIEKTWLNSMSSFQGRLRWHCHFMQKLEDEPSIEFENINRAYDGIREDQFSQNYFDAWCHGQTGYPMVDACMRALHQIGWINFRMRAMLVSFASYHLWLHWRQPALYLARLFVDYEPGIHYSQIQMQSGVTGINTVRIYSPIKQVTDQDPQGIFIRRFVPELEGVPDQHLPQPHLMTAMEQSLFGCQIGKDYPHPIVDHKMAYKLARDRIFEVKKSAKAKSAAKAVYQKHGSRRQPMSQRR